MNEYKTSPNGFCMPLLAVRFSRIPKPLTHNQERGRKIIMALFVHNALERYVLSGVMNEIGPL